MDALDGIGQILLDLHLAGGLGAFAIGGDTHEVDLDGNVDGAAQIGHEDVGATQDADQQNPVFVGVVPGDLRDQLGHPGLELLLGEQDLRDIVVHFVDMSTHTV